MRGTIINQSVHLLCRHGQCRLGSRRWLGSTPNRTESGEGWIEDKCGEDEVFAARRNRVP
ncbi:conserved hypothetical protein [Culex quinquefasciatus]|uniref:Uncharacterized protein n=1 Tax=Culex quinquefasciatus TaxID=7176 RepID=B0WC60_CULQU|nr:conserved hypothetical protein [Culex quinquefasciatus]|eukprot:XP_001846294.1 conserved hypothetical protein [Culex quinquefasciatus]